MYTPKKIKYLVYDLEGHLIAEGSKSFLVEKLHMSSNVNFNDYTRSDNRILKGKYKVRKADYEFTLKKREMESLEGQIRSLKMYGNTVPFEDVEKNIRMLKERGLDVRKKESGKSIILELVK